MRWTLQIPCRFNAFHCSFFFFECQAFFSQVCHKEVLSQPGLEGFIKGRSPSMATRWSGMNACISLREVIPQLQLHLCQCSVLTLRALIWEGPGRAQCWLCWWDSCGTHWGPGSGSWLGHRNGLRVGGQRGKWELTRHCSRLLSTVKETLTYHDICVHAGKFLFCFPAQWFLEGKNPPFWTKVSKLK